MSTSAADDKPVTLVIFGGSGDLTQRKLIPSLFNLYHKGRLPKALKIVGLSSTSYDHEKFRQHLREGMDAFAAERPNPEAWKEFASHIFYLTGDLQAPEDFARAQQSLRELEAGSANRIYYLATPPTFFPIIAEMLGRAGLAEEKEGWRRIVVEKPFGRDLASAQQLNQVLHAAFPETRIFRMDHYLGKETAQNILFFRFANSIFEQVWNRDHIDNVQITVAENIGVGHRGGYYDQAGVLRDMFQNHLLQLLCLVTMEPPISFQADAIRDEKVKALSAIPPIQLHETVRGQYRGYRPTPRVAPDSVTATFGALKLWIENRRWQGVPFYLRSGKSLASKSSQIVIEFKRPPHLLFDFPSFSPNQLSLCLQPDEGIHLQFEVKVPDSPEEVRPVNMEFHYPSYFGATALPDAYDRLLLDVYHGDAALFPREDGIETAWRLIDPVVQGWASPEAPPLSIYDPGATGPPEADELLARDGRSWWIGCESHADIVRPG